MGEIRNAYKILVGKPEEKRPLRRPTVNWGAEGNRFGECRLVSYGEISGSHGVEYEDEDCCLPGCSPDDGGSKDLRNVGKLLPDYTVLQPRRQQSSYSPP
jgi:hypothetical protein